jgi:hypothetical protein
VAVLTTRRRTREMEVGKHKEEEPSFLPKACDP